MVQVLIFDLDGILADSEPWWNQIDTKLLAEYGATYRGEYHKEVLGVNYSLAVDFYKKAFGIKAPAEEMIKRRGEIAAEFFADRVGLFPHTSEVLQKLRGLEIRLGLATSSVSASARPFLDRHELTRLFEAVVTGDEVEHGKPAPDIYLRAAEMLGAKANNCLVVEDSLSGIAAARAAKMRVAAIPDRRFVDAAAYQKQADYVLNDLNELVPLVVKLSSV